MNKEEIYLIQQPTVSVLLPIRNESVYIARCLDALADQDYPADLIEILVVDGMSTDDTRDIVHEYAKRYPQLEIQILDNRRKIVPTGMNIALRQARYEIIIRVDGHCMISPDYIGRCVQLLQENDIDGVGGPLETIGEDQLSQTIALAMSSPFGVGGSAFRTIKDRAMLADSVPFPAYTRQIIEKVGLYDEELVRNQDDEYNYRIRKQGGKILLSPDINSCYYSRGSLKKLWKQYYQYGFWKVRVLQKHPRQMSLRQFVPPVFVLALFTPIFLSDVRSLSMIVPLLYLLANLVASLHTASKRGWHYLLLLPVTFTILHVSYGFGFLVGLFKFWNRWGDKLGKVPVMSGETVGRYLTFAD